MSQQTVAEVAEPTLSDLVDHLTRFDGPPDQFLLHLLAVQCHIGSAGGGAIVRTQSNGEPEVLAAYPALADGDSVPLWLGQAVENLAGLMKSTDTVVLPVRSPEELYDQTAKAYLVIIPLRSHEGVRGIAVFLIEHTDRIVLGHSQQRLELTVSLLSLYEMRLTLQQRQFDLQRLRQALEVLASVNDQRRFKAAGMAFCNEVASVWEADRVTLGFIKGRYVRAAAMSHTEKFTRKMKLVLDIETAMEECFDQDVEVIHPASAEATYVSRAAGELAKRQGPNTVCSLPLRQEQKVVGVLTVERPADKPYKIEEIESLRLVCELATARAVDLYEHDKWIGAKAADSMRKFLATLVGPEHTWVKALVAGIFVVIVFFVFAKGNDYVDGSFVIEADRRVVAAPYPCYLEEAKVMWGERVEAGQLLATLKTSELNERLRRALAERRRAEQEVRKYWRADQKGEQATAQAAVDRVQPEIDLIERQIEQANIKAPIAGVVIRGDWMKEPGRPFETGNILFEIAPLEHLRAELLVPEDRIGDLERLRENGETLRGQLAPKSHPGRYLPVEVERISPIADVVDRDNVFRVRAEFRSREWLPLNDLQWAEMLTWLRPGHEGVARIKVGRARYAWLWTRDLINWVRMKLWW